MTETTVSDKPWTFTGFGTIRCGRHTVLHLNANLADEVSREEYERVGRIAAAASQMRALLRKMSAEDLPFDKRIITQQLHEIAVLLGSIDAQNP